jgi:hypothetical protein
MPGPCLKVSRRNGEPSANRIRAMKNNANFHTNNVVTSITWTNCTYRTTVLTSVIGFTKFREFWFGRRHIQGVLARGIQKYMLMF